MSPFLLASNVLSGVVCMYFGWNQRRALAGWFLWILGSISFAAGVAGLGHLFLAGQR